MLISDLAMRDMDREAHDLLGWIPGIARWLRRPLVHGSGDTGSCQAGHENISVVSVPTRASAHPTSPSDRDDGRMTMPEHDEESPFRWRRHHQLRNLPAVDSTGSPAVGRDAHSLAARGVFLARCGRLEQARVAFAASARDDAVSLSDTPDFWSLSRSAMLAASDAYADVGRFRDASALAAHVRTTYRPRAVRPVAIPHRRDVTARGD